VPLRVGHVGTVKGPHHQDEGIGAGQGGGCLLGEALAMVRPGGEIVEEGLRWGHLAGAEVGCQLLQAMVGHGHGGHRPCHGPSRQGLEKGGLACCAKADDGQLHGLIMAQAWASEGEPTALATELG